MIDLELIDEVTREVVGHSVTPNEIALGALLIGIVVAVSFQGDALSRINAQTLTGQQPTKHSSVHPNSLWAGIVAIAVGIPLSVVAGKTAFTIFIVALAALMALIAFIYTLTMKRDKGILIVTGLALVSVFSLGILLNNLEGNEIVKVSPTEQASAELDRAESKINKAIVEEYNVEVIEDNSCWPTDGFALSSNAKKKQAHEMRVKFVELAASKNPDSAPGVRLLTGDGVVGCYSVLYDNKTGEAKLIVDAENTELPSPAKLREE